MRLGVMGGTFDPVHNAHLKVAAAARECGLDAVVLVPARRPPHKDRPDITDPFHRFAMAALATVDRPGLCVSSFEVARDATSYTIDTVRHFVSMGHDVTLIMGTDSLVEIETWRDFSTLVDLAGIIAFPRRKAPAQQVEQLLPDWLRPRLRRWPARSDEAHPIVLLDKPVDDTSSTEIRRLLKEGVSVAGLLPPATLEYILKHRIYAGPNECLEASTE